MRLLPGNRPARREAVLATAVFFAAACACIVHVALAGLDGVGAFPALLARRGVLHGLSAVAAYGLFRLLLKPPIAIICAGIFLASPALLQDPMRPHDDVATPLLLLALFCLLFPLVRPLGWKRALWAGAAAGAAAGLAANFHAGTLAYAALFIPAAVLFYPGWRWPAWGARGVYVAAFVSCFMALAWPALSAMQTRDAWTEPVVTRFAPVYDARPGVGPGGYRLLHTDRDAEALAVLNAHNQYLDAAAKPVIPGTPGYGAVARDYASRNLLRIFPGDLATRTAAAALRLLDGPRPRLETVEHPVLDTLYRTHAGLMNTLSRGTSYLVPVWLILLGAVRPRLGLLVLYLGVCLAGTAALLPAPHLDVPRAFVPLAGGGAVVQLAWWAWARQPWGTGQHWRYVTQGVLFTAAALVLLLVPFHAARGYQDRQLARLFTAYESAEREAVWPVVDTVNKQRVRLALDPVSLPGGLPEVGPEGFFQVEMLVIAVAPGDAPLSLQFRYTGDAPARDLTWQTTVEGEGVLHLYVPLYNAVWPHPPSAPATWTRFEGLELDAEDLPRLQGMHRLRYAAGYTPLVTVTLGDNWRARRWYQRLSR